MNHPDEDRPDQVDRTLAALLEADDPAAQERSRERSRRMAAFAIDDAIASERTSRVRPGVRKPRRVAAARRRPALALAGGLAVAVLVAGALAPLDTDERSHVGPFAPADASAAQVLGAAAARLDARPAPAGDRTWHAVSTGTHGRVTETWFDASRGEARWATFLPAQAMYPTASYYVLDATTSGTRIRQYLVRGEEWRAAPTGQQINDIGGLGSLAPEAETLRWLAATDAARDEAELRAANERFAEQTQRTFTPPAAPGSDQSANARALQVLHLLRVAQQRPDAVAQLYRDLADLESLTRLDAGTLDGKPVIRLQLFEAPAGEGGEYLENVLLLDPDSGAPLGTESLKGTLTTRFEVPVRVEAVGEAAVSCGAAPKPPCSLLAGTGAVAAAADRAAARTEPCVAPTDPTQPPDCLPPGAPQEDVAAGGPPA